MRIQQAKSLSNIEKEPVDINDSTGGGEIGELQGKVHTDDDTHRPESGIFLRPYDMVVKADGVFIAAVFGANAVRNYIG